MRIVLVNPRGIKGDEEYIHGMAMALYDDKALDVSLFTNFYYEKDDDKIPYSCKRFFFRKSEKMRDGLIRKVVRISEYIIQNFKLIRIFKMERPDVVHAFWSVVSPLDAFFFRFFKKYSDKFIFTAHNVLPHINKERYKKYYKRIYSYADKIIVHGEGIYKEFVAEFPEYEDKLFISRHGKKQDELQAIDYNDPEVKKLERFFADYKRIFLCFGMIYYNKGFDRMVEFWKKEKDHNDTCLVLAGKIQSDYKELTDLFSYMDKQKDLLFLNKYISNNLLNYLLSKSDLILIPYRHASMSGVMLTAAAFSKPVLCTNVGSLSEYMDEDCGWLVENDDDLLFAKASEILHDSSKDTLQQKGMHFHDYVNKRFNWSIIVKEIIESCYM